MPLVDSRNSSRPKAEIETVGRDRFKSRAARKRRGTYSRGGKAGFYMNADLIESAAWSVLSGAERAVLVEMLICYGRLSGGDMRDLPDGGMTFTHGMLHTPMDQKTFLRAKRRLVETGFFAEAPREVCDLRTGAPTRYTQSIAWKTYSLSEPERAKSAKVQERKEVGLQRATERRADFYCGLRNKKGREKSPGYHREKSPGYTEDIIGNNALDTRPEKTVSHRAKCPGLSLYHRVAGILERAPEPHRLVLTPIERGRDLMFGGMQVLVHTRNGDSTFCGDSNVPTEENASTIPLIEGLDATPEQLTANIIKRIGGDDFDYFEMFPIVKRVGVGRALKAAQEADGLVGKEFLEVFYGELQGTD